MYEKDFTYWHTEKTEIQSGKERPFFHEREVWFSTIGANIGFEQDGRGDKFLRPVLILKKFNNEVLWAIPLTTKSKQGKYYFSFSLEGVEGSTAILSQLRLLDAKRLQYKIGNISTEEFKELKTKLRQLLD
jgi:mRNA interferase MazF